MFKRNLASKLSGYVHSFFYCNYVDVCLFILTYLRKKYVSQWYELLTKSREDIIGDARPGSPSASTTDENVKVVKKFSMENRRSLLEESLKMRQRNC